MKLAPDAEMTAHLQRVAQSNPLFARRKMEAEHARGEALLASPPFRGTKALCDMAGLTISNFRPMGFAPMRSAWPNGPDLQAYVCRVETEKGVRAALFYRQGRVFKRYLSVLVVEGGGLPVGSSTLTRAEYAEIVPNEGVHLDTPKG